MVDVNGNTTPSGDPVELVNANEWSEMTITELFDQRYVLNNRMSIIAQYGTPEMLKQIKQGMAHLDAVLRSKEKIKYDKNKNDGLTGLI